MTKKKKHCAIRKAAIDSYRSTVHKGHLDRLGYQPIILVQFEQFTFSENIACCILAVSCLTLQMTQLSKEVGCKQQVCSPGRGTSLPYLHDPPGTHLHPFSMSLVLVISKKERNGVVNGTPFATILPWHAHAKTKMVLQNHWKIIYK